MIFRATWADGRQLVFRVYDASRAIPVAKDWRKYEPFNDHDIDPAVFELENLNDDGPVEIILAGWSPWEEATS